MRTVFPAEELVMSIKYLSCPLCQSKNIEEKEVTGIIVVTCKECNNKIDIYPKEQT